MNGMSRNKLFTNRRDWGMMKDTDRCWNNYFYKIRMTDKHPNHDFKGICS